MIILHQLWNQRRANGWIFVELLVVAFFLWIVVDPIYVITANQSIPKGYEEANAYMLLINHYNDTHGKFDAAQDAPEAMKENILRIFRTVKSLPETEAAALLSDHSSFPNAPGYNGGQYFHDTVYVHSQTYSFAQVEGSDLLATYRLRDYRTGEVMQLPADCGARGGVFITEEMARTLFGTADARGLQVRYGDSTFHEVRGVLQAYKARNDAQPTPLLIRVSADTPSSGLLQWRATIALRVKPDVDAAAFERRFRQEVAPQLNVGNFYFTSLRTLKEIREEWENTSGTSNALRLHYALAGFALLCVFLGMTGTFWIRCNTRRQDMGLMKAMGASRGAIVRQFLAEAWWLVTTAFLLSLIPTLNRVYASGFANATANGDPAYWQNQPLAHCATVTLLVYLIMLFIAALGTYIPVRRASRTLPAEALRDE
ncbi:MAG: FtsX-like permease family protein [Prevotellaceae bacterium]|jgi:hypothetical protein|nr:FtsX-like permease family protein [Prevotellaceae bacterium]